MKTPSDVDRHVGARIRSLRMARGESVQGLAAALGLSPRQLQACEDGSQRVGAHRLREISRILKAPPSSFFEGFLRRDAAGPKTTPPAPHPPAVKHSITVTNLLEVLMHVQDAALRKSIFDLARALSADDVKSLSAANDLPGAD